MKITVGNSKKEFWYFISFPLLSHGSQFLGPDWEWGVSHDLRGALYCGSTERRHPNEDSWFLRHLPVLPLLRPLYIFFFNEAQEDRYKPLQHHNIKKIQGWHFPLMWNPHHELYKFTPSWNRHDPFSPHAHAPTSLLGELHHDGRAAKHKMAQFCINSFGHFFPRTLGLNPRNLNVDQLSQTGGKTAKPDTPLHPTQFYPSPRPHVWLMKL